MKEKTWFSTLIENLFLFFILTGVFFSFRSDNFSLDGVGKWLVVLLFGFLFLGIFFRKRLTFLKKILAKLNAIPKIYWLILLGIYQLVVIWLNHTGVSFDVKVLYEGATLLPEKHARISHYLSENPNNYALWFFYYTVTRVFNKLHYGLGNLWPTWQSVNALLLDLGILSLYYGMRNITPEKKAGDAAFWLAYFSLGISPWILVPYSDTLSFATVSIAILIFSLLKKLPLKKQIYGMLPLGIWIGICYGIKPSSVVFLIAMILVEIVQQITTKTFNLRKWFHYILVILGVVVFIFGLNTYKSKQQLLDLNKEEAKPVLHFVLLGVTNNGGYSAEDSGKVNSLKTQKEKKQYVTSELKKRLKQKGPIGYLKFIIRKEWSVMRDGDFYWGKEGLPQDPGTKTTSKLQEKIREFYNVKHRRNNDLKFIFQILWVVTLCLMAVTAFSLQKDTTTFVLKVAILGAAAFLLLFESGRSRYLIQFLPLYYFLAGIGYQQLTNFYHTKKDLLK